MITICLPPAESRAGPAVFSCASDGRSMYRIYVRQQTEVNRKFGKPMRTDALWGAEPQDQDGACRR